MKFLTEYRNPELVKFYLNEIEKIVTKPWNIMEICGGQTHSLVKNGLLELLPDNVRMIHGPGCPVCVTPISLIDKAVALMEKGAVLCSFGDMVRVPGSKKSLLQAKADGGEDIFCIDSMPIQVCRPIRSKRCKMGKNNYDKAPNYGYCASQGKHYYGYKLHSLCGLSGVIHSFDLTKASVHDIHYLKDVKCNFQNCTIIGDRGYIGAAIQLDLFEKANIKLEVPYRSNQKDWKPVFSPFAKARKRVETLFAQLCDQFMIIRNYAKQTEGLFTRITGKISALTILQYINKINNKPIGQIKYALI
jgi:hypothetical protein